jgi:hypothetical protein
MRTVQKEYYTFIELSEEIKIEVIETAQSENMFEYEYDFYYDDVKPEFIKELTENGFPNATIKYSGFYSQGDGLCFDSDIDLAFFCETIQDIRIAKLIENGLIEPFSIEKNSYSNHYSHKKTRAVTAYLTGKPNIDKVLDYICIQIDNNRLAFCDKFYKNLEENYDYVNTVESITSHLIEGEYEFEIDGTIV